MTFHVPELSRIRDGQLASTIADGNNGAFSIRSPINTMLWVIASDGEGWEHVSVSLSNRTPNWSEMCFIKGLFWDEEDCVVQYHPPRSQYINCHPYALHLWRPTGQDIPTPPSWMVGPPATQGSAPDAAR